MNYSITIYDGVKTEYHETPAANSMTHKDLKDYIMLIENITNDEFNNRFRSNPIFIGWYDWSAPVYNEKGLVKAAKMNKSYVIQRLA
jgi:hypothetical protein